MKIGIYTVPHTGTHFVMQYLSLLGFWPEAVVAPENYVHRHAGYKRSDWEDFSNLPCIITARDPYLCALRFLHNGQTIEDCTRCWDDFFDSHNSLEHVILDIGARPNDRYAHLRTIAEFANKNPEKYAAQIKEYADNWISVKGTTSELKQQYLETGDLPEDNDWKLLDDAVAWYKNLPTNSYI